MSCHVTLYSSHLRQQIQCYSTCRQIPFSYLDDPSNCMNSMRKLHLPKNRRLLKPKGEGLVQIILPSVSGWCSNPFLSHYLQGLIQPRWCRISIHLYPCAPPYNFKDLIKRVFCFFCQPTWSNPPPKKKKTVGFGAPNSMGGNGDCTSTPLGHAGARFRKLRFSGATLPSETLTTSGLGEMTDWKFRRSPEMTVGKRSQKK